MRKLDSVKQRPRRGIARIFGVVLALLLVVGVFAVRGTADAAPPYASKGTVTDLAFVSTEVTNGSSTKLTANWSFPNRPAMPAGFTIDLPKELEGRGDTFTIKAEDTGERIATCVATKTQLQCDLDPAYVRANPVGLRGDVQFWVTLNDSTVTQTETKTYDVNGEVLTIQVNPDNGTCPPDCGDFEWDNHKDGWVEYAENTITWYVQIGAPQTGMAGGERVTVLDMPVTPGMTLRLDGEYPALASTTQVGYEWGEQRPINFEWMDRSEYTLNPATGEISFVAEKGHFYQAIYLTDIAEPGSVELYENRARITKTGETEDVVLGQERWAGGSGSGIGTDVGVLTIAKKLDGDAAAVPANKVFTGTYTVTPPRGEGITGTWSVKAGEQWRSPEFPRNSKVTLTEDTPQGPDSIVWSAPEWSQNDFTLPGGTETEVTVTNTATVPARGTGVFSASKVVDGTAEAVALIPDDATFTLAYSYPAGPGFEAGKGTLTLPLDGTKVTSPKLPVGAKVELSENAPAAVKGAKWGTPEFSPSSLTIGAEETISVTVTNPIEIPEKPEKPEQPPVDHGDNVPPTGALPDTGSGFGVGSLVTALLLLLAGASALVLGARGRRHSS